MLSNLANSHETLHDVTAVEKVQAAIHEGTPEMFESLREPWQQLAAATQPFYQPEWFEAFTAFLAAEQTPLLLTVQRGKKLTGVLPLERSSRFFGHLPATTLRSLSNLHSCRYDLVQDGSDTKEVARAAWETLKGQLRWDVIEALDVPPGGAFESVMECARLDSYLVGKWPTRKMPFMSIATDGADPLASCPSRFKSLRQRLRRKENALRNQGAVEFSVQTEARSDALAHFFRLESSGWKRRSGSAIACSTALVSFYTAIAKAAERQGMLRLYSLRLRGEPIAMQFGLEMNETYYSLKIGYDEAYQKFSPGQMLMKHVINDLAKKRVSRFDLLGPRMEWKSVWTDHHQEHNNCYIFRPGLKGALMHATCFRLGPHLRKVKYRFKGDPQAV
jgi:CelD/BcsL family acetyltransferase involved in cellulose biosynthesis